MTPVPNPRNRFMTVLGAVILIVVGLYFGFSLIDNAGLEVKEGEAVVTGKHYREASTTYHTEKIGNQTRTLPQAVPPGYFVNLELDGRPVTCEVERARYEELSEGARVRIRYKQLRVRKHLQGVAVLDGAGG
jgi:hypothetical protein